MRIQNFREYFFDIVIIDGLINNNDRNKGNFGLLFKNGEYKLAPVFDNGASFYSKTSDERLKIRLNDNNALEQSFLYTQTVYILDDKELKFRDILNLDNEVKKEKEYYYKSMKARLNNLIIPGYKALKNLPN